MYTRLVIAMIGLIWMGFGARVHAEDAQPDRVQQLEQKVDELTKKLAEMQKKLEASQKTESPAATTTEAKPAETASAAAKEAKWYDAIDVSGFIDGYYSFNFNRPKKSPTFGTVTTDNTLRNFDFADNQFSLNLAELVLNKAATKDQPGFKMKFAYGPATDWIHLSETAPEIWKHVLEAYLTVPMKKSQYGDKLDFGKFATHHGAEVIETKDNWNYTRSFLFSWATPYYHMGARYWHYLNKDQSKAICFHVYNGWNDVKDNNEQKSVGIMYTTPLGKKATGVFNYTGGDEPTLVTNAGARHLLNTVLTYNANSRLTYMLDAAWAHQAKAFATGDAEWYAAAGYAKYALSDRRALIGRLEYFNDRNGFASMGAYPAPLLIPQAVKEATLTYEIKGPGTLLTRFELRRDWSDAAAFLDSAGGFTAKQQTTLLLGTIYPF